MIFLMIVLTMIFLIGMISLIKVRTVIFLVQMIFLIRVLATIFLIMIRTMIFLIRIGYIFVSFLQYADIFFGAEHFVFSCFSVALYPAPGFLFQPGKRWRGQPDALVGKR